ncbi:MAG: glycyl-radical enzyme activating protein [Ignavibacteria bacterium]|nr:glycyl-radical enzyme activating protein [Ignavibacteria bacterium]
MSSHKNKIDIKGVIFDLKKFAIHDGPGIRTTIFFKGCPLRCWWCHNPESHKLLPEKFDGCNTSRGLNHPFSSNEDEVGREVTVDEIINEIEKDRIFYDESGGGVTFSGGEPLMQPDFLKELLTYCKSSEINSSVDTSGYSVEDSLKKILDLPDNFLFDLKMIDDELHQKYTGVSNKQIHKNLKTIDDAGKNILIRIPVVPGITDSEENFFATRDFISTLNNISEIDILPYHRTGEGKYNKFSKENKLDKVKIPKNGYLEEIKKIFNELNCKVKIGG